MKLKQLCQNELSGKGKIISLTHSFENVDDSLEEVRILLKNAVSHYGDLMNQGLRERAEALIDQERVSGKDLGLGKEVNLGDKNVALFFQEDKTIPVNLSKSVQGNSIVSEHPFILPLVGSLDLEDKRVYVISDEEYECYNLKRPSHLIKSQGAYDSGSFKEFLFREYASPKVDLEFKISALELSEESLTEARKKYLKQLKARLLSQEDLAETVLLLSQKFLSVAPKVFDGVKAVSYFSYNPSPSNDNGNIEKRLKELEIEAAAPRDNASPEGLATTVEEMLKIDEVGDLKSLLINQEFLSFVTDRQEITPDIIAFNNWVCSAICKGVDVKTVSSTDQSVFTVETYSGNHQEKSSDLKQSIDSKLIEQIKNLKEEYLAKH